MSSKEIVTLVEDFHRAAKGPKQWVRRVLCRPQDFFHLVRVWSLDPSLEIGVQNFKRYSGLCLNPTPSPLLGGEVTSFQKTQLQAFQ